MKSLASLILLLAAAQEPPPGDGPRGTSQIAAGEVRYDAVGYANRAQLPGVSIGSRDLPPGSYAEVTALDSGRTIVAAVVGDDAPMTGVALISAAAADALGQPGDTLAVRVRKVVPTAQDVVQLRDGGAASFRTDAPPALLVALRKKLPLSTPMAKPTAAARAPKTKPSPAAAPTSPAVAKPAKPPSAPVASGYVVQVAALSSAARAAAVAKAVGGTVVAGPPLWRVRIGPFADAAAANRAKAEAAAKGYAGGQITRIN